MDISRALLISGILLLSAAALLGLAQHAHRHDAEAFARWRVVHAGGTAGAVQLLVLAALARQLHQGMSASVLAAALIVSTYAFFVGPLLGALGQRRAGNAVNLAGAIVAVPAYLALPVVALVLGQPG